MLIYLAKPIDKAQTNVRYAIRTATQAITERGPLGGSYLYDPHAAFSLGLEAKPDMGINNINGAALDVADVVLVLWPKDSRSWGVPVEVDRAVRDGKIVALVTEEEPTWAMQYGEDVKEFRVDPREQDGFTLAALAALHWLRGVADLAGEADDAAEEGSVGYPLTSDTLEGLSDDPEATKLPEGFSEVLAAPALATLPVKRIKYDPWREKNGDLPIRAHADDAGLDLFVSDAVTIPAGEFRDVPTNIAVDLPRGTWGYLTGRSSTLRKKGLLVNPGVIDEGYTGELFSGVQNLTSKPVTLHAGERVSQLIILPNLTQNYKPSFVAEFDEASSRGSAGFGSSGA